MEVTVEVDVVVEVEVEVEVDVVVELLVVEIAWALHDPLVALVLTFRPLSLVFK